MAQLLATLEDFAYSRGADFDPADIQAIIALEGASATVRTELARSGQHLDDTVADEITLDGSGTNALLLPELPVNAVASVSEVNGDTETLLTEGTDYRIEASAGILRRLGGSTWIRGFGNYAIIYDHGWVLPDNDPLDGSLASSLPADIQGVVRELASLTLTSMSQGGIQMTSASLGAGTFTWQAPPPNQVQAVLDRLTGYQFPRVA